MDIGAFRMQGVKIINARVKKAFMEMVLSYVKVSK